ncbi:MAG TPA: sigma-70 family RNA polymerase sigma factor [Bacillota bacterium]|jgi:RNA polymerase sigma-70 factor (ECF subfamily)|nr:sigma-70 family RNA polymerase sigma factor [Bacillota bacterium]NLD12039.1 sigma-70 family RNA polymerase sigma factor [Bacillota bacterium]HOB89051.1 sigma-70 family RNA polymerase sigma factor [Bacillota bacterium]HOJ57968.1 sigma-70 family RNA polymerase sigma factor [Bacillota bacterium]HOL02257.1 sigma-70 family RNA polymerase sigma factor [Bacillota bacterium]
MLNTQAIASAKYRENDIEAFEELVRTYDHKLYRVALRLTGDPDEAKDLAQEALFRAYRAFDRFKMGTSFERWLFRIASNLYIDKLRKRGKYRFESLDEPIATQDGYVEKVLPDWTENPERIAQQNELSDKILAALQSLPLNYRMAVVLYDLEGFSYEEISGILQCSIGTVRSRIHRGRRLLRKKLAPYVYQETEVEVG